MAKNGDRRVSKKVLGGGSLYFQLKVSFSWICTPKYKLERILFIKT